MATFAREFGYVMQVKTGELKNYLSRYIRRVRETGESITVCDRDKPVAVLAPLPETQAESEKDRGWL